MPAHHGGPATSGPPFVIGECQADASLQPVTMRSMFSSRLVPVRPLAALGLLLAGLWPLAEAQAWSLTIAAASRRVFLHVGNGLSLIHI